MRVIQAEQRSPEWFAARCGLPTASRFADVISQGKDGAPSTTRAKYIIQLALERVTGLKAESVSSPAMDVGVEREPLARAAYETLTGNLVTEVGLCLHDEVECGASPDGLVGDDGLIEIKCPQPLAHAGYLRLPKGSCPPAYRAQVQGQMWITGRLWCDFISFNPDFPERARLAVRRVAFDKNYCDQLHFALIAFLDEVRREHDFVANYQDE